MKPRVAFITDGSASAKALADWLRQRLPAILIEGRNATDVRALVSARRMERPRERVVSLALADAGADIAGGDALGCVASWLADLSPIERRARGAEIIESHRRSGAHEPGALERLLGDLSVVPRLPRSKRGRPPGANPFRGVGFDVCVALLLAPDRRWTERDLALETEHAPSAIHRVLRELGRRGYLLRVRGASRPRDAELLRDDLLPAWRARIGVPRAGRGFSLPAGTTVEKALSAARKLGFCVLAGPSAVEGPEATVGGPTMVYVDQPALAAIVGLGASEVAGTMAHLVVWDSPESGVFRWPRTVRALPATNRVVTFLDLASTGVDRAFTAAESVWTERST
ncbi:MAG: hypothetical protein AABZ30_13160 [Myxococcota bacterium]